MTFVLTLPAGATATCSLFADKSADLTALPQAPPAFEVMLFASAPPVRQPCSMAFDERGRLDNTGNVRPGILPEATPAETNG